MFFKDVYIIYKIGNWCLNHKIPIIPKILNIIKRIIFPACDIPFSAKIGEGAIFPHRAIGVIIHSQAQIGDNVKIQSNVVIGGSYNKGVPIIGNNVLIGTGVSIIGSVHIGNDCIIGAGAVVLKDVPDGVVVGRSTSPNNKTCFKGINRHSKKIIDRRKK